ncbi:MAG TPA: hypothetical protein VJ998_09310, partial [Pseudomonadales bacterium]|nr:hypothetical protein [Pseudomonadales bacterium]
MREPFPDIEIYLKRPAVDDVVAWLDRRLGVKARDRRGDSLRLSLGDEPIQCTLVENAVKGGYMSVWFKS